MKPLDFYSQPSSITGQPYSNGLGCADEDIRRFIVHTFANHYNARIETFCDQLMGVCNSQGELLAAAGYNLAEERPLFLEQYLDLPLEQVLFRKLDLDVRRDEIAEVGNLAAGHAGGARMLIELMTKHLYAEGRRWVAFTATRSLINSFKRLGLSPVILTPALPDRVRNPSAWGTYYSQNPMVAIGDIHLGHTHLGASQ